MRLVDGDLRFALLAEFGVDIILGHLLEGVGGSDLRDQLPTLTLDTRIDALRELLSEGIALLAGLSERNVGIGTERHALFLVEIAIFEPPQLRALGINLKVEAALIRFAVRFGRWLERSYRCVGQRHMHPFESEGARDYPF